MEVMSREQDIERFNAVLATKPSKQSAKAFLLRQATAFLGTTQTKAKSRQERRLAAKQVAKRLVKKVNNGEEIL